MGVFVMPDHGTGTVIVQRCAAGGDDRRAQGLFAGSRNPALGEPAKETFHHLGRRQS